MNIKYSTIVSIVLLIVAADCWLANDASAQNANSKEAPNWFKQADKDGDGKLTKEEAPNKEVFGDVDTNQDGFASLDEVNTWLASRPSQSSSTASPKGRGETNQSKDTIETEQQRNRGQLPENVEKRSVTIWSDGTRMAGDLYLPKNRDANQKLPAIVFCAGTGGTKSGTGGRLGPTFAAQGYAALAFDYRGWGESDSQLMSVDPQAKADSSGEMTVKVRPLRWQMNYTDQTEDIRAAISFLAGEPCVDPERIGIMGSSYGGGLVTWVGGNDPRVKCVVAQVPGLGATRSPAADRRMFELHTQQARGETEPVPIETGKLGGKMERYDQMRSNPAKNIGFYSVDAAKKMSVPILFVVAENEELSNNDNVLKVHEEIKARGVPTEYVVIKGITHYGIYREGAEEATKIELAWFDKYLKRKDDKVTAATPPESKAGTKAGGTQTNPPRANRAGMNPKTAFERLDGNGDGELSDSELATLQSTVPFFKNNPDAFKPFMQRLDTNRDGKLNLEEYKKIGEQQRTGAAGSGTSGKSASDANEADNGKDKPSTSDQSASPPKLNEAAQLAHFEKHIRPILVSQCYACHSVEKGKIKGGLALDNQAGLLAGGDSGPAIVPGDSSKSLLVSAIQHSDDLKMPPNKKLTDKQINDFVVWIDSGALDPRVTKTDASQSTAEPSKSVDHWAYKKPELPKVPSPKDHAWAKNDIDRFVAAGHEKVAVKRNGDASPETLVRRLYFDLTGLPPTPQEVASLVDRCSENRQQAIESTVEQLLSSERFGERWGRHWLDVARFAESSGKETNFSYPHAWRYRDYVIDSFNRDVPFDQFVREQIAGDLLPAEDDQRRTELIVATGFLALGSKSHIERNKKQFEMDVVDEQIDTVTQAFLGVTVACARCHDHKFDPIPQSDYYALAGIFRSTETFYGTIPVIQNNNPSQLISLPENTNVAINSDRLTEAAREGLDKQVKDLRQKRLELTRKKEFASAEFVQSGILLATLEAKIKAYEEDGTPKKLAMGVHDRSKARDSELFVRGEIDKPGEIVPRGFVSVLCSEQPRLSNKTSGRLELANWIASSNNPLTARVIVNRVWQHIFGRGLVETPDNFGISGSNPSHPELLDYLAVTFMEEDKWSIKSLIRRIVSTRVYQLDSVASPENLAIDPDNKTLWRVPPRRLDAEEIRDAMLFVSGTLDLERPIGSVVATGGEGYTGGIERFGLMSESKFKCRSVYLPVIRGRAFESMDVFDGVDGSMVVGKRDQTTVPTQSLYLLNSPYVMELATSAAGRLTSETKTPEDRVIWVYDIMLGRKPTEQEVETALAFIDKARTQSAPTGRFIARLRSTNAEQTAWAALCQSVWASGEFLVRK